ncbi:hypothetical protein BDC45DRAFT_188252 [Circinella umbellata]|nr:hypothetical protein BDC45DRAFT_188252 [Circinella umbellata]
MVSPKPHNNEDFFHHKHNASSHCYPSPFTSLFFINYLSSFHLSILLLFFFLLFPYYNKTIYFRCFYNFGPVLFFKHNTHTHTHTHSQLNHIFLFFYIYTYIHTSHNANSLSHDIKNPSFFYFFFFNIVLSPFSLTTIVPLLTHILNKPFILFFPYFVY